MRYPTPLLRTFSHQTSASTNIYHRVQLAASGCRLSPPPVDAAGLYYVKVSFRVPKGFSREKCTAVCHTLFLKSLKMFCTATLSANKRNILQLFLRSVMKGDNCDYYITQSCTSRQQQHFIASSAAYNPFHVPFTK